jgi:hypothetical protein
MTESRGSVVVPKGIMVVESGPAEGREDEYNDWYTNTHIPEILTKVPGFTSATRYRVAHPDQPGSKARYLAIYELEADDLSGPPAELRKLSQAGQTTSSAALATSPPPVITLYEVLS